MMNKKRITIIGGGNMGEAIIASTHKRSSVSVCEKSAQRRRYLKRRYRVSFGDIKACAHASDIIILAVKPQDIDKVLMALKGQVPKSTLIISVAAGVTTRFIERRITRKPRVVRTMPNMPALIGQGITALCAGSYAKPHDLRLAKAVFTGLGKTVIVKEKLLDSITAVSGSGPAYVYLFMECLIDAAQKVGLKKDVAAQLVAATFQGSVNLLAQKNCDPRALRKKVTSKGGTTQAATEIFMNRKIDAIITAAVKAAQKRAKALARQ